MEKYSFKKIYQTSVKIAVFEPQCTPPPLKRKGASSSPSSQAEATLHPGRNRLLMFPFYSKQTWLTVLGLSSSSQLPTHRAEALFQVQKGKNTGAPNTPPQLTHRVEVLPLNGASWEDQGLPTLPSSHLSAYSYSRGVIPGKVGRHTQNSGLVQRCCLEERQAVQMKSFASQPKETDLIWNWEWRVPCLRAL